tara:strand:- start:3712 stop:4665 length:954 start_codon:yes stop_codon:yes gene_type:complete
LVTAIVITSDGHVWNLPEVVSTIELAKFQNEDLILDLNSEGPDFETLDLTRYISTWDHRTIVKTRNAVQSSVKAITFKNKYPHFLDSTKDALKEVIVEKHINKTVGMFVGRSNEHRLYLSSYIYNNCSAHQTFRYDPKLSFHRNNLGLEKLIENYGFTNLDSIVDFLSKSPLTVNDDPDMLGGMEIVYDLYTEYKHFFVELVCETYYSGRTFFPTEKTWRPVMLLTPFIVQGPQWFLHRLRDMGFQTFDRWWDEGYSEDPANHQPHEIIKVIDYLAHKSTKELNIMYKEMQPVLTHNRKRFMELTSKDFKIFENDRY